MKKLIYTALAATLALTGCTQQDELPTMGGSYPNDGVVRINTTVGSMMSRSGEATPYEGRTLGLELVTLYDSKYSYSNIEWTMDDQQQWTPIRQMLWESPNTEYFVFAYAPFTNARVDDIEGIYHQILTDQSTADGSAIIQSDLVSYAHTNPSSRFTPATGLVEGKLPIHFGHALSKFTVQCTMGSQWAGSDVSVACLKVLNTCTKVLYNFPGQSVMADGSTDKAPINMRAVEGAWEAIIAPLGVEADTPLVEITLTDGTVYHYTTPGFTFAPGTAYRLALRIGKDKIEVVQDVTVGDWDSTHDGNDLGGGEAVEPPVILDITVLSADDITDPFIASHIGSNGSLVVSGEYTGGKMEKISAYVRAGAGKTPAVAHLDLTAMTGLTSLYREIYSIDYAEYYDLTFNGSNSLTTAKLPTTVTDILNTFMDCSNLTSVTGLDNVTIASYAFYNCASLTKAPHMPKLEEINHTFEFSAITEFVHDKITAIKGSSSFSNCSELTKIDCPNVAMLRDNLFSGDCDKLTEIRFTAEAFGEVWSSGHYDPFTEFSNRANATLYLNASQRDKVELNGTDCIWIPYELGTNKLDEPVVLTGFKSVYCGDELVYSGTPAVL